MVGQWDRSRSIVKLTGEGKYNLQESTEIRSNTFGQKLLSQMCRNLIFLNVTEEEMFSANVKS